MDPTAKWEVVEMTLSANCDERDLRHPGLVGPVGVLLVSADNRLLLSQSTEFKPLAKHAKTPSRKPQNRHGQLDVALVIARALIAKIWRKAELRNTQPSSQAPIMLLVFLKREHVHVVHFIPMVKPGCND